MVVLGRRPGGNWWGGVRGVGSGHLAAFLALSPPCCEPQQGPCTLKRDRRGSPGTRRAACTPTISPSEPATGRPAPLRPLPRLTLAGSLRKPLDRDSCGPMHLVLAARPPSVALGSPPPLLPPRARGLPLLPPRSHGSHRSRPVAARDRKLTGQSTETIPHDGGGGGSYSNRQGGGSGGGGGGGNGSVRPCAACATACADCRLVLRCQLLGEAIRRFPLSLQG